MSIDTLRVTQPLFQLLPGSPPTPGGEEGGEGDIDLSPPPTTDVKNEWKFFLFAPVWLHGVTWDKFVTLLFVSLLFTDVIILFNNRRVPQW